MKKALFFCVVAGSLFVVACSMGGGGANSALVVTGTITVLNNSYWNYVKIGVFSGGTLGVYPKLGTSYAGIGSDVTTYRISYIDLGNGSAHPISLVSGSTYSISDTSGISSAYSFELPATVPAFNSGTDHESYYYGAWYDGNGDSSLGLIDTTNATTGLGEEFNRMATRATMNGSTPTTVAIEYFMQSYDYSGSGKPTGNYKYYGYNGASFNDYTEIKQASTGFNFNITAASGW